MKYFEHLIDHWSCSIHTLPSQGVSKRHWFVSPSTLHGWSLTTPFFTGGKSCTTDLVLLGYIGEMHLVLFSWQESNILLSNTQAHHHQGYSCICLRYRYCKHLMKEQTNLNDNEGVLYWKDWCSIGLVLMAFGTEGIFYCINSLITREGWEEEEVRFRLTRCAFLGRG